MMKTSTTKVFRGQHIFYRNEKYIDDLEFVVLDKYVEYCLCISANPLKDEMPFDKGGSNDWNTSSLRRYLNEEYILRFNQDDLEPLSDGYIAPLSKEEVKQYKDILPKYHTSWWTCSADVSGASFAWLVSPSVQLTYDIALSASGVAPSCVFNLNNLIISQEENNIIFESKN